MKNSKYKIIQAGITDTSEAKRGEDIYYKCKKCGGLVSSVPKVSASCECGNVGIDKAMNRLWIGNYEDFIVLRKL